MHARPLIAVAALGLATACSIVGGVDGDYVLGTGGSGASGVGGGGGTGASGGGQPWVIAINGATNAHVTDMIARNSNVYVVGWYVGNPLRINEEQAISDSNDGEADGFVAHFAPDGSLAKLAVFGRNGVDKLHGLDMLASGDVVVVGESCADRTFIDTGAECTPGAEPRAVVAELAGTDFVVINAQHYGDVGGRADRVHTVDVGDGEGVVVASNAAVTADPIENCDVGPNAGSLGYTRGLAVMHITPTTLACEAELYRWPDESYVTGIAVVNDDHFYTVGHHHGADALTLNANESDASFLVKMQRTPVWNDSYDGMGADEARDAIVIEDDNVVVAGALTEGTTLAGLPTPASRAAMVARYDASGTLLWGQLLSTNAGSDAIANAVGRYGASLYVIGSFSGDSRIFNDSLRLDAIGERDLFMATLDVSDGRVTGATSYGRNGRTVEPTRIVFNESAPIVAGHTDDDFDTPSGSINCRGGNEGCAFVVRLTDP